MLENEKQVEMDMFLHILIIRRYFYLWDLCFDCIMMNAWKDYKGTKQACLMNMCANALKMQDHTNKMVNVSLCISISQVPKDTSCSRWIFSFPIRVHLPLAWAIKSLNKTIAGHICPEHRATQESALFLPLILIINLSGFNWLNFLLKCGKAKVVAYVSPLGRIRSSRSSIDIFFIALIFS